MSFLSSEPTCHRGQADILQRSAPPIETTLGPLRSENGDAEVRLGETATLSNRREMQPPTHVPGPLIVVDDLFRNVSV
mgnify:CR=1 FL=1|jgi:hypothetical protein